MNTAPQVLLTEIHYQLRREKLNRNRIWPGNLSDCYHFGFGSFR